MQQPPLEQARFNMVEQQVRPWEVLDPRVLRVMADVPRDRFLPEAHRSLAYADTTIPLGRGQVIEEPKLQGRILQALAPQPYDRALDVGTGSGYLSACLARLASEVHSVDIFPDMAQAARAHLGDLGINNVRLEVADAGQGLAGTEQRYDVIAVTGSLPVLHQGFHRSLTVGGRLFLVTGTPPIMEALLITRQDVDQWITESILDTCLPPLINSEPPPTFSF